MSSYKSWLADTEKNKFEIEKNTKILTGSAKYTKNRGPKIFLKKLISIFQYKKII